MNATGPHWWCVIIGSGNGLVLSGNKPLPEQSLTLMYVTMSCGITRTQCLKDHLQVRNNILTFTANYICSPRPPSLPWVACLHILRDHNILLSYYGHTIFQYQIHSNQLLCTPTTHLSLSSWQPVSVENQLCNHGDLLVNCALCR